MIKKVAYTVCSANHLAHAKTMADSLISHNPDYMVYIGLVDRIEGRFEKEFFLPHTIVEISDIGIPALQQMSEQYTIIELNCAMKPYIAQHLITTENPDIILYFDSDIFIYHNFEYIEALLEKSDVLITPHFTKSIAIGDNSLPKERELNRGGLYNAGFLGMKKSGTVHAFLHWWADRLVNQCYYNFAEGMGVDQTWLNVVPLFFDNVNIVNHKGMNFAYWNFHERVLIEANGKLMVNETVPLIFFHISGYSFDTPEKLSKHQDRFDLNALPLVKSLLNVYTNTVKQNKYDFFSQLKCHYAKPPKKSLGIMSTINKIINPLGFKISSS